jgi:hypothetical protein
MVLSAFKPLCLRIRAVAGQAVRNSRWEWDDRSCSFDKSLLQIHVCHRSGGHADCIFESKWHVDAELVCRSWTNNHSEQLLVKGRGRLQFPPIIKLRLARSDEIAAYPAESAKSEVQESTRIVYLRELVSPSNRAD